MGIEIGGLFGLLILIADVWATVSTLSSRAGIGVKVLWILLVILLPVLGFLLWLVLGPKSAK